jgi:hypothetical protein
MSARGYILLIGVSLTAVPPAVGADEPVDFNRDVRPILSERCFACHGPDENTREAEFRLDVKDDLFADRGGYAAVVPGRPETSELLGRVASDDESLRMPPADHGPALSAAQIDTIRRWIAQGAEWKGHWAYVAPTRPEVPAAADGLSPIDHFVRTRLAERGLTPSARAERVTLIRRLSFDLTGLPPTFAEVERFVNDERPDAYEQLVERLLESPHHAERMTQWWLDLVRYADTNGIHGDNHREVWMYRDWVIGAFQGNMPFDEFTTAQLAGDLVAEPTEATRIASGYNRLLMTTREGGAQAKEYTAKYAADRVRNASTVWLGATLGCAECHDHKFDPILTKDFYSFAAFFADVQETAVGVQQPTNFPSTQQAAELQRLDGELAAARKTLADRTPRIAVAETTRPNYKLKPEDAVKFVTPELNPLRGRIAKLEADRKALDEAIPETLVTTALAAPRTMRVLPRGNWLDDSGPVVQPSTPAFLPELGVEGRRANRLDLAKWILAEENPLTARVFVNRLWGLFFGQGLVATADDFGSQGAWPTHPKLLDWLAVEFMESGWDVRHMIRLIVTSETYRQQSGKPKAESGKPEEGGGRQADPYNKWLARQGTWRLDAEMVRDNALAVSGLLVREVGGPSVKPYQPHGYWKHLNFPAREWTADTGRDQYRRGLYTYWCRTFLHPSLLAFDASTREECTVDRPCSNTPLQALALLNDPTYVEAARALAERVLSEADRDTGKRLAFLYRTVLSREPRPEEVEVLSELLAEHRRQYEADRKAAAALLVVGQREKPENLDAANAAAWTSVARTVLSLHETITRP